MKRPLFIISALLFCLSLLTSSSAFPQSALLKGKVSDAADNSPIAGANVVVLGSKSQMTTTSLGDGTYLVRGLKQGDQVVAYYSRGGYRPNPMPSKVVLSNTENLQDVQLIKDTAEEVYWRKIATKVKAGVESATQDQARQIKAYDQTWSTLAEIGLQPDAQVQAARQLGSVAPLAATSHRLMLFATIDDKDLHLAEANICEAAQGKAALSRQYSVPSEVAVSIAVSECLQYPSDPSAKVKFSKDFEAIWGSEAANDLRAKQATSCLTPNPSGASHQCLDFAYVPHPDMLRYLKPQ